MIAAKRLCYYAFLIAIPIALFALLEGGLRLAGFGTDLRLFRKSTVMPGYYEINPEVGKRYFAEGMQTGTSNDIFLIKKPDSCYRIFVLGESTAEGFPYQPGIMFSRILQFRLQDAFPHKRIEVVNTAMAAITSYALLDQADEIIRQHPDAILIYAGHNEYYGALGIASVEFGGNIRQLKKLHLMLVHLRSYQLIQKTVNLIFPKFTGPTRQMATLMESIARGKTIEPYSKEQSAGISQFRANLSELLEKCSRAGLRVILSEQVCNVRDQRPFKSIASAGTPGAEAVYEKAQELEREGDYRTAKEYYYGAKDLDAIPFRAPEAINAVIQELGRKYGDPVVPMKAVFESRSPHGLIGHTLILEHVHPNVDGYFLMADAFFSAMRQEHCIADTWDSLLIRPSEYYRTNWGFTLLDSLAARIIIGEITAGWPFKPELQKNDFLEKFVPTSSEDSIAYRCVVVEHRHFEDKHIELAVRKAQQWDNIGAFNEYYSLIKSFPWEGGLYCSAADYLAAAGDYRRALDLLLSMPDRCDNGQALCNTGALYLKLGYPDKALAEFTRAKEIRKPDDSLKPVLAGLYAACRARGDRQKQDQAASAIRAIDPLFDFTVLDAGPGDAEKLADRAEAIIGQGLPDSALALLQKSLLIKETYRADKLIGDLYYKKNDFHALMYLERARRENGANPDLLVKLFVLYYAQKNLPQAAQCLDEFRCVSKDPKMTAQMTGALEQSGWKK